MEFRYYLLLIWRWKWLLAASTLLAAAVSLGYSLHLPRVYRATTTLMVGQAMQNANPSAGDFQTSQQLAQIVVYKTTQWLPLAWLGASREAAFAVAVVSTLWGDFNHSNLDVGLGRLGTVLNSPRMHLWHHDQSDEGGGRYALWARSHEGGLAMQAAAMTH